MKQRLANVLLRGFLCGMLLAGVVVTLAGDLGPSEYQVKAAFLYNFAKFVKWPENAFSDTNSPIVIGILGEDPFGPSLDLAVQGKTINGHPLIVRTVGNINEAAGACQVLFVCKKPKRNLVQLIAALRHAGILTVGDTEHFIDAGGMINFVSDDSKVRFEINDLEARRAGLTISSKLLSVAQKREKKP